MNTATPSKPPRASGFWWALAGFGLGSLVSVGFNLQSAWLPAAQHGPTWSPSLASQAAAIVWPLTLIVSVEVLSRIAWPDGWGWRLVRTSGILAVALGSATISYGHIYEVLTAWGYDKHQAIVGPLVVDGLMLISGFALVSLGHAARTASAAPATVDQVPAGQPAHTDPARRPQIPPQAGDEPHAVSPATPQSTPGETAPEPPARPTHSPIRPVARSTTRKPARPRVNTARNVPPADGISDADARTRLRAEISAGNNPTVGWARANLGVGDGRARRLLAEATRPELHTVKNEEVAVG